MFEYMHTVSTSRNATHTYKFETTQTKITTTSNIAHVIKLIIIEDGERLSSFLIIAVVIHVVPSNPNANQSYQGPCQA